MRHLSLRLSCCLGSGHVVITRREIWGPWMFCTDVAPLVRSSQLALSNLCCTTQGNEVQYTPQPPSMPPKKHPYCFSFLPLSWYKRLRQEVKSGMCVQSVESPGDSEVYALLFLLKLCLGPINWDRKRWDRVETLWISCFAMQILGYNTDLLCLLHGHS